MLMKNAYINPISAIKYLDFLNSPNGEIQKRVLAHSILSLLPKDTNIKILDAGCGNGWLSEILKQNYSHINACDASIFLINFAKSHFSKINFQVTDLEHSLPYPNEEFNVVILNMVLPDVEKLPEVFKNISGVLKPNGNLITTIPNPKYTYPAAEWKRSIMNILLGQKPQLQIKSTPPSGQIQREYAKNSLIDSYFYNLSDYILNAKKFGFELIQTQEIKPEAPSTKFDLNYQLSLFPLLLTLNFKKT